MAILIALQQRKETASALADKLEVSKRTIIRDMQTLSEIGVYALLRVWARRWILANGRL